MKAVTIVNGQPELEIAVDPVASIADQEGSVEEGTYTYEIVWETDEGDLFGFEIDASTSGVSDFQGAIQLNNLPETSGQKTVYRTDKSGEGDRKEVGRLSPRSTTFVDTTADANRRGDPITAQVQQVQFAGRETVKLSNVGEIRPPSE